MKKKAIVEIIYFVFLAFASSSIQLLLGVVHRAYRYSCICGCGNDIIFDCNKFSKIHAVKVMFLYLQRIVGNFDSKKLKKILLQKYY